MPELLSKKQIIDHTAEFVMQTLRDETTGHGWWHIDRVRKMALMIGETESADLFIIELAALLHDIADHKFHGGDEEIGPETARNWLESLHTDESVINEVCTIIKEVSYKGAKVSTPMSSIEGEIVQDADRLDAMGAIGIARAFAYGGRKKRKLYDPEVDPTMHDSFSEYKNDEGHTINHFYEKLLLLKTRMNTDKAKEIAQIRHSYMEEFVSTFLSEWNLNQ